MHPIFIVVTANQVIVTNDRAEAAALSGTVYRVNSLAKKTTLCTISGAASPYTVTDVATSGIDAAEIK